MSNIRISRVVKTTRVEGPGLRYSIWVQGCPIKCEGCFNPHTWAFDGGTLIDVEELFEDIKSTLEENSLLEGVTFLGGEPFSQAKELSVLAEWVRELGLSIVTFTGYEYENITIANNQQWNRLLEYTDLLIDGPYIQSQHDLSRPWVGSKNQQYRFLSNFYKDIEKILVNINNKLEIRIHPDGRVSVNGMAEMTDLEMLSKVGIDIT
ncbi:anaerobic ribonucleoside-triphosphate reductase activating protein [Bacillus sp. PS06]|uniref:anaerobic ribonucleoside-triphosphate reductase activating protein n=1 Tax=Bacillus sp. PS06 TaxID=2764176 RepID=UPI0017806B7E|nr:anaerobic ribonucleoside-triphosphate reductase activating protein [Bacillus sp. PS06]MBD8067472.1 anaerobic ribonucleoside-triphosphate reductase activating protein [Bacillus sp. PS06]